MCINENQMKYKSTDRMTHTHTYTLMVHEVSDIQCMPVEETYQDVLQLDM